ncbi:MAG: molybdopterin converting factor subunit 1 [Ignavibacteriae bacterium]|nr:molybdopterin converting factor subunit 1 [Ignavibacteriota bacterium]
MIEVTVKFFASVRDIVGKDEYKYSLPEGASASDVLVRLSDEYSLFQDWKNHLRIAVNYEYVPPTHVLKNNDEVAIIPPVSGG